MDVDVKKGAFPRLRCSFLRRCVLERSRPASCSGLERSHQAASGASGGVAGGSSGTGAGRGVERSRPVSMHAPSTSSVQMIHRLSSDSSQGKLKHLLDTCAYGDGGCF